MMKSAYIIVFFCVSLWAGYPSAPLTNPLNQRSPVQMDPLLLEYHRMMEEGKNHSFYFPRVSVDSADWLNSGRLRWTDSTNGGNIWFRPLLGLEYRQWEGERTWAQEGGMEAAGTLHNLSYRLDTRIFSEQQPGDGWTSFDHDFIELQDESRNANLEFTSYARYRAWISLDLPYGRFSAGREAHHWGPAVFYPLVLGSEAVPYSSMAYTVSVGPFTIRSVYGSLVVDGNGFFRLDERERTFFGHRYEWRVVPSLLLGISETLILLDTSDPFAFIPIIPLFMEKGQVWEPKNNGNLAFDMNWQFMPWGRFYSEFLIDDMTEPSSLFNDYWGNKWAWTVGSQLICPQGEVNQGLLMEYTRVEPWVYTHYSSRSVQAQNREYSLANPLGPNAQGVSLKYYASAKEWQLSVRQDWIWKGSDEGSDLLDTLYDNQEVRKEFLAGEDKADWVSTISGQWVLPWGTLENMYGINWRYSGSGLEIFDHRWRSRWLLYY
jgi:hypothetical protein